MTDLQRQQILTYPQKIAVVQVPAAVLVVDQICNREQVFVAPSCSTLLVGFLCLNLNGTYISRVTLKSRA